MKFKKTISLMLSAVFLASAFTSWAAASNAIEPDNIDEIDYFIRIANDTMTTNAATNTIMTDNDLSVWSLYDEANELGYVSVDDSGHYVLDPQIQSLTNSTSLYHELLHMFDIANDSISRGLCYVDPETYELVSVSLTREIIEQATFIDHDAAANNDATPYSSSNHGCAFSDLYLGGVVSTNYAIISDYWDEMIQLSIKNPNLYPKAATIGFWVGKIQEGGEWDYKVKPGYSPYNKTFCCTYGKNYSKQWVHRTSEFIGNYNYGYTGQLLFSLSVLKKGSDAAAGNFFEPDTSDYPAITEGYNDASAIE